MTVRTFARTVAAGVFAASLLAAPVVAQDLHVTLKPRRASDGRVDLMEVTQVVDGAADPTKPFSLSAPLGSGAVQGIADRIVNLQVKDASGPVPMRVDDPQDGARGGPAAAGDPNPAARRLWTADRAVAYPVTASYLALVQPAYSPGRGPGVGLRPAGGGVAASTGAFLALPLEAGTKRTHIKWDLSDLPPNSMGVLSAGEGDFVLDGGVERFARQWMVAGPLMRHQASDGTRLTGYVLGKPPFNSVEEIEWGARAYKMLAQHLGYNPTPYMRAFFTVRDSPPWGGGSAGENSFHFSMGESFTASPVRVTFVHEMGHSFIGTLSDRDVPTGWFAEGLNVYITSVLPLKYGLRSPQEFSEDVTLWTKMYYGSPGLHMSLRETDKVGFSDELIRRTPYARGLVYFADLNSKIRARSGGKRNLDALVLPLLQAHQKGAPLTLATWEQALERELGPEGLADFRAAVMEGRRVIVPPANAFGPCLMRVKTREKADDGSMRDFYGWVPVKNPPLTRCGDF